MQKIKLFIAGINPTIKLITVALCGYIIYKKLHKTAQQNALNNHLTAASGQGIPAQDGTVPMLNLAYILQAIWSEEYDPIFFSDKDKIIALVKSIPLYRMREFATLYSEKVINEKSSYAWAIKWHDPTGLNEDLNYFLGSRFSEIKEQLNSI